MVGGGELGTKSESDLDRHVAVQQNSLNQTLTRFVNVGRPPWWLPRRGSAGRLNTEWLSDQYNLLGGQSQETRSKVEIDVPLYEGGNVHVHRMADALASIRDHLVGAFIHGSIGSCEEVPYSDFDGLVILSNSLMADSTRLEEVARHLRRTQSIMIDYDPLQHHGWFVLTELDLAQYCEAYFPLALFEHAKVIPCTAPLRLEFSPRDSTAECVAFIRELSASLTRQAAAGSRPDTMYELKSFLSRVMLLPAAFLQARDGSGVWKRDSFDLAEKYFDANCWFCIDQATVIRDRWPSVKYPNILWRNGGWSYVSKAIRKRASGGIKAPLKGLLREEFYESVQRLVQEMFKQLDTT